MSHLQLLHYVSFAFCPICILSYLHFAIFAFCFIALFSFAFCCICIISHLHFVLFAFCHVCILLHLHFVVFAFRYICIMSVLHFVVLLNFVKFAFSLDTETSLLYCFRALFCCGGQGRGILSIGAMILAIGPPIFLHFV